MEKRSDKDRPAQRDRGYGRNKAMTRRYSSWAAAALCLAAFPTTVHVAAQTTDCTGLKARIEASSGAGARAGQYAAAFRRQQYELQRTQAYATSIGCDSNFFGTGSTDCDAIASRIERMQDNLDQLQQRAQGGGEDDDRRRALAEQYNTSCTGETPDPQVMPVDPDAPPMADDGTSDEPAPSRAGHVRALCVKHCDGGFFPITDDASSGSIEQFDQLCKAQCPNAEASLYTVAPSGGIETAVAADGTPYTALPAAFKFQTSFDASCSCKPPHQSWVEALGEAEKLIERGKGDVTVTQKMSDAMSRPATSAPATPAPAAERPPRKTKAARKAAASPNSIVQQVTPMPGFSDQEVTRQLRRDAPPLSSGQ